MTGTNTQTNGASLEDCHANFFSLTDVCGIKWIVFRENDHPPSLEVSEDPVLVSFARCLDADLVSVWRRVPRRALLSNSYDLPMSSSSRPPDEKNLLCQRKELWIFWYGDKPEDLLKKLVSPQLKEVSDISGTWENVLPYEARTLLYKALNNLIERNLLSRDFVRLGKWFVQPFEGPERPLQKASHLSFSFHYFVHGESFICAAVDVRQHPAVRRLSMHHLNVARSQSAPVPVLLAPYGLAATLTGVSYRANEHNVAKLLKDWEKFYPLDRNKYLVRDTSGDIVSMPAAVEVIIAGVRLLYPTCYVLVTDMDTTSAASVGASASSTRLGTSNIAKAAHAARDTDECTALKHAAFSIEPSPFTTSNHPLLCQAEAELVRAQTEVGLECATEHVWQDGLQMGNDPLAAAAASAGDFNAPNDCSSLISSQWNFGNPGRLVKKKPKNRPSSREKSKDRSRFNSKFPFHKKAEALDELAWEMDGTGGQGAGCSGAVSQQRGGSAPGSVASASMRPPGSVRGMDTVAHSPASVGPVATPLNSAGAGGVMTPKGGPGSVRTPGDFSASLASPADCKPPSTPKSVPPSSCPAASPFPVKVDVKSELDESSANATSSTASTSVTASTSATSAYVTSSMFSSGAVHKSEPCSGDVIADASSLPLKRPLLPVKEYETSLQTEIGAISDNVYDNSFLQHWLSHPVKKFRPAEQRGDDPLRPMYRRASQTLDGSGINNRHCDDDVTDSAPVASRIVATDASELNGANIQASFNTVESFEFNPDGSDDQRTDEDRPTDLFTSEGLKPSMGDLDNIFDDSSSETEQTLNMTVPTPPGSNKPAGAGNGDDIEMPMITKLKPMSMTSSSSLTRLDPTGNLPHDQLAKMFPTPPSHEHNLVASPAEVIDGEHGAPHIKVEPPSPESDLMDWSLTGGSAPDDSLIMLASSKFAPLQKLYSDDFPPINLPIEFRYKPKSGTATTNTSTSHHGSTSHQDTAPLATSSTKAAGMSPMSPLTSVEGPRSHHGPASVGGGGTFHGGSVSAGGHGDLAGGSPASVSSSYLNKSVASVEPPVKTSEANALLLNLVLADSLLNLHRDHNFDSCTMCVCTNDCNIRGRDVGVYLPDSSSDDVNCMCGFSAVINRRLAYQSGLFYEDETEATGITEDLYYRKKPSLLHIPPDTKPGENLAEKSSLVDGIPAPLLELVQQQAAHCSTQHNTLVKYSRQYLKSSSTSPHSASAISMVEWNDSNEVVFAALDLVKTNDPSSKLEESLKGSCIHKWTLLQAPGPNCSEDIIRVMKALQPVLHEAIHVKKTPGSLSLSVTGPLTWRQFHQMAGASTKGNTDDQCEPLPVPSITVGHEKDFMTLSPLALHYWESLSVEPFSQPRDIAYIVVAPDNDVLVDYTKRFFRNLSVTYETCRLGRHVPITKMLRDGILKIDKKKAEKLANEDVDQWFDLIGDSPTASMVRLYSQVCRHYLLPVLSVLPMDRTLMDSAASQRQVLVEKTPASPMPPPNMTNHDLGGNGQSLSGGLDSKMNAAGSGKFDPDDMNGKENIGLGAGDLGNEDSNEGEIPAVVIYMIDPFSLPGQDNSDMFRLSCLGLLRSFSQMLPHLNDILRHNIYLQLVPVQSLFELTQSRRQSRLPGILRSLAFSVYSQAQKPLRYQRDCKTLTGFGSASNTEKYLKINEAKAKYVSHLHCPAFVLSSPPYKKKTSSEVVDTSSDRGASVLFCNYFLSEDQQWLLATCCDDRGELLKTVVINIEIPNKSRRKRASARRVGLRKLMDWILGVMASALVPWRLVIGRIGRIGHGELRGWSVLLSRKSLKRASKELREMCSWHSDVPSILSACLVSMEPDSSLRLMTDQFTPDERFGQTASNCQLSTPRDASCTHILVFPTSAKAQSSQKAFEDHNDGMENDLNLGLDVNLEDMDATDGIGDIGDIGDFNDIFKDDNWGGGVGQPGSPSSPKQNSVSRANSPGGDHQQERNDQFRYGQEEVDARIELLQQPLALGYLVSTARTGPMPRWFWSSCPHLEHVCPVFLKSALHINVASVLHGGDDGYTPTSASGRVHSLDSTYTADVLRYVLEGYNALSWLSVDHETRDRRSCLPLHVQILLQMYNSLAALF